MRIYKTKSGIVIEQQDTFFLLEKEAWDLFINDDQLYDKLSRKIASLSPIGHGKELIDNELEAPIDSQEIWASGVTYYNSKMGRQEESKEAGGGSFYSHVYEADRPELFFKAAKNRTVGSGQYVNIRADSSWDVPEPELTLFITSNQKIVGYTIGNDMSSRSIEGENPLYLPQAKTYDGSAAIGPCLYVPDAPLPTDTNIQLQVVRAGNTIFADEISISQIKRKFEALVEYLFRACTFPHGCFLMTGTGIVPGKNFTLQHGDEIGITIDPIGTLINKVSAL